MVSLHKTFTWCWFFSCVYSYEVVLFSDINECTASTHNCESSATCVNNPGSFTCTCAAGYSLKSNGLGCDGKMTNKLNML